MLYYLLIVIILTLYSTRVALAASNTFKCAWNSGPNKCRIISRDCNNNYNPDPNFCDGFSSPDLCKDQTSTCLLGPMPTINPNPDTKVKKICEFAGSKQPECEACMGAGDKAWTAIGCIDTKPDLFIKKFITFGAGLAGGIAFLLILFGGFQVMTSTGNPEKLNAGKELVVSAITGLLLVIFSIFLLKIIGYNILGIPGFG